MDRLQRLSDIEEIRLLKARYFYNLDHKLWDGLISLFTADTVHLSRLCIEWNPPTRSIADVSQYELDPIKR